MRLFSNRSQMMSLCGKYYKITHEAQLIVPVTDTLTTQQNGIHLFCIKEKKNVFNDDVICVSALQ